MSASVQNADLRKRLRVDRVKKMQMTYQGGGSIEDPNQPEWLKKKSLREIEVIRETKKSDILHQVLGDSSGANVKSLSVTPGQLSFLSVPISNQLNQNEVFTVRITDPDETILGAETEMQLVTDQAEMANWVALGKTQRPPAWNVVTRNGDVILQPGQSIDLFFKFLTFREVTLDKSENASKHKIRPRRVQIVILMSNRAVYQHLEVHVMPSYAPIDHFFRYFEPEESHYSVPIPPFVNVN